MKQNIKKKKTQIVFTADSDLKAQALKKTKEDGITLKALLNIALKSYVNNELSVGFNFNNDYCDDAFFKKENNCQF